MNPNYQQFIKKFPNVEQNKPLAPLNTFGIGGPADLYYKLTATSELQALIETAKELNIPVFMLGGGSNTIFADAGLRGLVIHIQAKSITMSGNNTIAAEAGALLSQVIQFSLKNGLSGLEKLMGLPGTIGGAVRGNAGAFGVEIQDVFEKALIYNQEKGLHEVPKTYFQFKYRTSIVKTNHDIILTVYLKLKPTEGKAALAEATEIVKSRISKQPKGKCSGSFFKNPTTPDYTKPQDPTTKAGYLLEQIGAKGQQIGGVMVSNEHANWLMNTGNGTQKEVLELSKRLQGKVKQQFGIELEREVQLVNEAGQLIL